MSAIIISPKDEKLRGIPTHEAVLMETALKKKGFDARLIAGRLLGTSVLVVLAQDLGELFHSFYAIETAIEQKTLIPLRFHFVETALDGQRLSADTPFQREPLLLG